MKAIIRYLNTSPTQSAPFGKGGWVIDPVVCDNKTPDRIMGWVSGQKPEDQLRQQKLFPDVESAKAFATSQGWDADIIPRREKAKRPRNYLQNFES